MNEVEISAKSENGLKDAMISRRVKNKLLLASKVQYTDVKVRVYNKKVYLLGRLSKKDQIQKAATIASKIKGVASVTSYIRAKNIV
jgi:osmotically-inducible protein OsmY